MTRNGVVGNNLSHYIVLENRREFLRGSCVLLALTDSHALAVNPFTYALVSLFSVPSAIALCRARYPAFASLQIFSAHRQKERRKDSAPGSASKNVRPAPPHQKCSGHPSIGLRAARQLSPSH